MWKIRFALLGVALVASSCTSGDEQSFAKAPLDAVSSTSATADEEAESTGELEGENEVDAAGADTEPEAPPTIDWQPCGSIECGSIRVPIDHDRPDDGSTALALYRLPAEGGDPIGSLLVNYGGPGAISGEIFSFDAEFIAAAVAARFDVVTWDPRGTGESAPLTCSVLGDDVELDAPVDLDDGVGDELAEFIESIEMVTDCTTDSLIRDHLSTVDTARDMDLVRAALGDDEVTYLGYSYGTQIGWVYATLFPDRVRAMVLDGALPDRYFDDLDGVTEQLAAFERSYQHLVEVCSREPACAARSEGLDVKVERLAAALASAPIELADGSFWGEVEFRGAVLSTLYADPATNGADLDSWLTDVDERRDPSGLIDFVEAGQAASTLGAFEAVTCADGAVGPADELTVQAVLEANVAASPTFGSIPYYVPCELWDGEITPLPALDTSGTPPLLVIGNTLDPTTPYEDAVLLDEQLANSVLVTYIGAGHTIVTYDECIDSVVRDYFQDLVVPEPGSCDPSARYGLLVIDANGGAEVTDVDPAGAAMAAGIQVGDVVVAVDGVQVTSRDDLPRAEGGVERTITVNRNGEVLDFAVTPERAPWT